MKQSFSIPLAILSIVMLIFSACSKSDTSISAPSIVGTWQLTSTHIATTDTIGGIPQTPTTKDSIYTAGKAPIIQFTSGNYILVNTSVTPATTETGIYSTAGNNLTLTPISGSFVTRTGTYTVSNTLFTFTTMQSSINVSQSITYNFTRQ